MATGWPALPYEPWSATCETLHAHTQVLGKLAVALAPPEPQLQHAALRLTARGWETLPLPAPDGSGAIVVALDMRLHEATVEHSTGASSAWRSFRTDRWRTLRSGCCPPFAGLVVQLRSTPRPRRRPGRRRSTRTRSTRRTSRPRSRRISRRRRRLRSCSAHFGRPIRGRSTPVNAWWGSFDLAVSLFSGRPAEPPAADFITRNAGNAEQIEIGWWPGDARYPKAAFYAYAYPPPRRVRRRHADAARGAMGNGSRRVRARLGRRPDRHEPARGGARVRPLGHSPRMRGLRVGPRSIRERGGDPTAGRLKALRRGTDAAAGRMSCPPFRLLVLSR